MFFSFQTPSLPTLEKGLLRIAAFTGFAPFAWKEGHSARGRDIAFLHRFARAHSLRLVVDFHSFDRLWELPTRETADIAASGISLRRYIPVAWTQPYSEVRRTLLIRAADTETIRGMSDLGRLAVVPRSAAEVHADETLLARATLSLTPTLEHGIEDLLLGQIDAVGTGSISAQYHAARHPGLAMVDVHANRAPEPISFVSRPELREALDEFILANGQSY